MNLGKSAFLHNHCQCWERFLSMGCCVSLGVNEFMEGRWEVTTSGQAGGHGSCCVPLRWAYSMLPKPDDQDSVWISLKLEPTGSMQLGFVFRVDGDYPSHYGS